MGGQPKTFCCREMFFKAKQVESLAMERASDEMDLLDIDINICFALPEFWFLPGLSSADLKSESLKVLLPWVFHLSLMKLVERVGILKALAQRGVLMAFLTREENSMVGLKLASLRPPWVSSL